MSAPSFFEDIKTYVGFGGEDEASLRALGQHIDGEFGAISEVFYERMLAHPGAVGVFADLAQVERLKHTLVGWLRSGLAGPHDEDFYQGRLRIGRRHVQIKLPQQYMFTAMDVVRLELRKRVELHELDRPEPRRAMNDAVDRWLDLELAIMLQSFREDSEALLSRKERLAGIGQVAGTIGHELRNPLGVIESSLYLVRKRLGADEHAKRHLDKIAEQVRSANGIITDLLEMVREQPPRWERVDLQQIVARCSEELAVPPSVRIELRVPAATEIRADQKLLCRALVNLLQNAVQAMLGREGIILVEAVADEAEVQLSVLDDGPGFEPDMLTGAFEPLVTNRAQGVGLGLALVQRVAERHGGRAKAENREAGGAKVSIFLPRSFEGVD